MAELFKSEVANFREQQALQEEAARRALSGLAIVASHEAITARMERGAERILRLIQAGKYQEAEALLNLDMWHSALSDVTCSVAVDTQECAEREQVEHDELL
jgi:hypothetical protein